MNCNKLLFLCSFCILSSINTALHAQTDTVLIEARFEGLQPGKVSLVGMTGDYNFIADTTVATAGQFTYRRHEALPAGFYTFLLPAGKNFSILVDKDQHMQLQGNVNDLQSTMQVKGSLNTQLFYETTQSQVKQEAEIQQTVAEMKQFPPNTPQHEAAKKRQATLLEARKNYLNGVYKRYPDAFFTKFKMAGQSPELVDFRKPNGTLDTMRQFYHFRAHFWDGMDFNDARLLRTPVVINKLRRYIKEMTPQHPDTIIKVADALIQRSMPYKPYFQLFSNWIALQYENGKTTVMDGEAVFVHLVKKYFKPELAFWDKPENLEKLQKHVWEMEASLMGRKGPDVTANDINGQPQSIYAMKAPFVLVFMFSPDCEHCQKEAPELQRLYEKWKNKGLDIYGIAVNTTEAEWRKFVQQQGFTFTNVFDSTNRAIYAKYYVDNTPELYLLNKDRIIVAKNLKVHQVPEVLEREMKR